MMKKLKRTLLVLLSFVFVISTVAFVKPDKVFAATKTGTPIMVSMGDSYASGEGIEPFFGQEKAAEKKVKDQDWLAHRSQLSWSAQLSLKGLSGNMSDHKGVNWFFVAASGAETGDFYSGQSKSYNYGGQIGKETLDPQLDIFDKLEAGSVDYVTLSIGGNDIGFVDIVLAALTSDEDTLDEYMKGVWEKFSKEGGIASEIKKAYKAIADKAGSQAMIIVGGYPKLFNSNGFSAPALGVEVSASVAKKVNSNVSKFNEALNSIVEECRNEGMNIVFVDVQKAFEGHEAYTEDPYINEIVLGSNAEDLNQSGYVSSYSMHPNAEGAKAYAKAVQKVIDGADTGKVSSSDNDKKNGKTVRVITQKQLNKALKNSKVDTIILRTNTYDDITISSKKAKKKTLIVDAPYADIVNKSKFKSIEILDVCHYTENVSGNTILKYHYCDFEIAKGKTVKKVTFIDATNDYVIRKGASIKNVVIEKEGKTAVYDSKAGVYKLDTKFYEEDYPFDVSYEIKLDKSGRIVEFKTSGEYYDSDRLDKYSYDKNGNLTRHEHIDVDTGKVTNFDEYTYDSANRMITDVDDSGKFTYKYDSKGRVSRSVFENDYYHSESEMTYDSKGRNIKTSTSYWSVNDGVKGDMTSYDLVSKYNKNGFIVSKKSVYNNGEINLYEMTYDKAGNETYVKYTVSSTETEDVSVSEWKYEYDEFGKETSVLAKFPYSDGWVDPADYAG